MKKEIFKVCALGLVAVTLVTGCSNIEEGVKEMTGKEITISYEEKIEPVVKNIELNSYHRDNKYDMMIEAMDASGEIVWSHRAGSIAEGSDNYSIIFEEGKDYVYVNEWINQNAYFTALDKQTGEKVWQVVPETEVITCPTIIENEDKLYVVSGMAGSYSLEVFDLKTGKELKLIDGLSSYVEDKDTKFDFEYYFNIITSTMKLSGNELVFEVRDTDDTGSEEIVVGQLIINIDNYDIKFER